MLKVRDLFGVGTVLPRKEVKEMYRYSTGRLSTLGPIIEYFQAFPLKGTKSNSFSR